MVTDLQIAARKIASVNPATGEVLRELECAGEGAVETAVERARAAQAAWAERGVRHRIDVLRAFQSKLYARKSEVAAAITREVGKPLVEALVDVDVSWGAIGPFMLTEICEKHGIYHLARDPADFYPIGPDQFWQLLLPSYRDAVQAAVRGATFLHLWSELLRRSSYDMSRRPPVGSYLHDVFLRLDTLDRFTGAYSDAEIAVLLAEWVAGEHGWESRSENCCFAGRTLQGRVLLTMAAGALVHRDRALAMVQG